MMKLLIVDDERTLLQQLANAFKQERYIVETSPDGETALDRIFDTVFDLIILDIMMPKKDGIALLEDIRQAGILTPVLMLTAKTEIEDKIKGLDLGADDYLGKPFSFNELLARVRALLRRSSQQGNPLLKVEELILDTISREVLKSGEPIPLTAREFAILEFLLYNKGRAVSRFSLVEHVWGDNFDPFSMSNFLDVHVRNLRKKIKDPGAAGIIQTVRGFGYIIKDFTE